MTIDDIKKEAREVYGCPCDNPNCTQIIHDFDLGKLDTLITTAYEAGREEEREKLKEIAYNFDPHATYKGQAVYDAIDGYLAALTPPPQTDKPESV